MVKITSEHYFYYADSTYVRRHLFATPAWGVHSVCESSPFRLSASTYRYSSRLISNVTEKSFVTLNETSIACYDYTGVYR
ncbi:hypothetical protein NXZ84_01765 [Mechercharimyces sp. CAU 1602]|nr:hypothetical protein [Mechercharimyces sp. CAU 1602]